MDLYLLRHGIAEDRTRGDDSERRLTAEGEEKMYRIAKGMRECELCFELILTSPYARAKRTAEIVAETLDARKLLEISADLIPDGNPQRLVEQLNGRHSRCRSVLLVGHEPYLSRLISLLVSGDTGLETNLKKGGICKLTVDRLKYGRCAALEWLLTPRQMRGLA
jgi:phosphohistidine phosphatase